MGKTYEKTEVTTRNVILLVWADWIIRICSVTDWEYDLSVH